MRLIARIKNYCPLSDGDSVDVGEDMQLKATVNVFATVSRSQTTPFHYGEGLQDRKRCMKVYTVR